MNYTSEDFRIQYISTYTLYIHTDLVYDQLVVVDDDHQVVLLMIYHRENPSQEAMKILGLPFPSVYVVLAHQNLVWVPKEVFEEEKKAVFTPFFDHSETSHIFSKDIDNLGITALYEFDVLQINRWKALFPQARFVPVFEVVLKQAQLQIPIEGKVLGVHVYNHKIDLFVFVNGTFQFYNSFEASTADDLSYFVLQLFKQFNIDQQVEKILLSGTDLQSDWAKRLTNYTGNLELAKSKNRWSSTTVDVGEKVDTLGVLIDSVLCAS